MEARCALALYSLPGGFIDKRLMREKNGRGCMHHREQEVKQHASIYVDLKSVFI